MTEERGAVTCVDAGRRRYAVEAFRPPGPPLPDDVLVLDVRALPRGGGPRGAAVVAGPEGPRVLDLGRPGDIATLAGRLSADLGVLGLATILARYAAGPPLHNVIARPGDLHGLLEPAVVAALGVPPLASQATGAGDEIRFATYFVRPEPPDDVFRVGLDLWRVVRDGEGGLEWATEPLARLLESPRYSPAAQAGGR